MPAAPAVAAGNPATSDADRATAIALARQFSLTNLDPGKALWTTANGAEAIPGTLPPLVADYWTTTFDACLRECFKRLGIFVGRDAQVPASRNEWHAGTICGHMASNIDTTRRLGHLMPGSSGDALERDVYGSVRHGIDDGPPLPKWRVPLVGFRLVTMLLTYRRALEDVRARTLMRWRTTVRRLETLDLRRAAEAFERECGHEQLEIMTLQSQAAILSPVAIAPLEKIVKSIGTHEDFMQVVSGLGGVHESRVMDELWEVAHARRDLREFLDEHGYMGPNTGNLVNPNWREEPSLLDPVLSAYAATRDAQRPAAKARNMAAQRDVVLARLLAAAGIARRTRLRLAMAFCRKLLPMREIGKCAMVAHQAIGRMLALRCGRLLVEGGAFDRADDVFFVSRPELQDLARSPRDVRALVADRRRVHAIYEAIELPNIFDRSDVDAIWTRVQAGHDGSATEAATTITRLSGVGVCRGRAEGVARVVVDPSTMRDFEAGQILVCRTTDPSWSPLFSIAGAMVVDVGGMLSHSAIIAREIGIPTVVNTRNGTRAIRDGQRVRVDGLTGLVEILDAELQTLQPPAADVLRPTVTLRGQAQPLGRFGIEVPGHLQGLGIVPLEMADDAGEYGGKASSLSHCLRQGLPVPDGFALSWRCVEALGAEETGTTEALEALCGRIEGAVAVRSSGVGEDGVDASFAGQHETLIGVSGRDSILQAIRRVGASRLQDHVRRYREQMGQAETAPRMAIVVQLLVDADCAGVMFTRNPVTGGSDRVIEAAWGLGEAVVGSLVTPDRYRIAADGGEVFERTAGYKDTVIQRTGAGTYETQHLEEKAARRLCLEDSQLRELAGLARQCEAVFGGPQDTEWAYSAGRLYLLQSRPITSRHADGSRCR